MGVHSGQNCWENGTLIVARLGLGLPRCSPAVINGPKIATVVENGPKLCLILTLLLSKVGWSSLNLYCTMHMDIASLRGQRNSERYIAQSAIKEENNYNLNSEQRDRKDWKERDKRKIAMLARETFSAVLLFWALTVIVLHLGTFYLVCYIC